MVLLAAVPLAAHLSGLLVLIVLTVGLIALVVVDQIRPQLADSAPHP